MMRAMDVYRMRMKSTQARLESHYSSNSVSNEQQRYIWVVRTSFLWMTFARDIELSLPVSSTARCGKSVGDKRSTQIDQNSLIQSDRYARYTKVRFYASNTGHYPWGWGGDWGAPQCPVASGLDTKLMSNGWHGFGLIVFINLYSCDLNWSGTRHEHTIPSYNTRYVDSIPTWGTYSQEYFQNVTRWRAELVYRRRPSKINSTWLLLHILLALRYQLLIWHLPCRMLAVNYAVVQNSCKKHTHSRSSPVATSASRPTSQMLMSQLYRRLINPSCTWAIRISPFPFIGSVLLRTQLTQDGTHIKLRFKNNPSVKPSNQDSWETSMKFNEEPDCLEWSKSITCRRRLCRRQSGHACWLRLHPLAGCFSIARLWDTPHRPISWQIPNICDPGN